MDTQAIEVDKLAAFREVAAAEQAEKSERGKMSEAAKAKLRAINERDRANVDADAALTKEFNSRPWTVEQLIDFLAKSFGGHSFTLRRRAVKAAWRIAQGMRVYHIHDVSFLGELLPGEAEMSMAKFLAGYPLPEHETVVPVSTGVFKVEKTRPCRSGAKCIWIKRRKPAPAVGRSMYCTPVCQKADTARRKRAANPPIPEAA